MHVMQYEIGLPADYDMGIIRHRVATRGSATDAFPGLGLKAYVIRERGNRERGSGGSPVNQYAPFYLWVSVDGMNRFLWGEGFRGLCESFGRPAVQHWAGLGYQPGPARAEPPRAATRRTERIPTDADPAAAVEAAVGELAQVAAGPEVHSTALAVDPRRWELVRFTLWRRTAPEPAGTRYAVLHLSTPQLDDIETGRHW